VVWTADLADIAGTHLHPKDVAGAIVSLDWADPPESWRWAGPEWTGRAPEHHSAGAISGLTIEVTDPVRAAERWALVLGLPVIDEGGTATIESAAKVLPRSGSAPSVRYQRFTLAASGSWGRPERLEENRHDAPRHGNGRPAG
jgi:hypothetical protein